MTTIAEFTEILKQHPQDAEVIIGVVHQRMGYVMGRLLPEMHINYRDFTDKGCEGDALHGRKILYIGGRMV